MKILFLFKDRPGAHGGPVINAQRLLIGWKRRGWETRALILCGGEYAPSEDILSAEGIGVQLLYTRELDQEQQVLRILEILRAAPPDLFVPNVSEAGGIAARWAHKAGIPSIIAHRSDDDRNWGMAKLFALKDREWANCHLVCVSDYLKKESEKLNEQGALIRVIPSGVPLPELSGVKRNKEEGPIRVVYTGRFHQKQKRVRDMVRGMVSLEKKHPGAFEFTLIGDGEQKETLKEMVEEVDMTDRFDFLSPKFGNAYHEALMQHDILLLLSDYEGTPGSVMDGMACGLVPVVKRVPGIEELVIDGENGMLVKDRGPDLFRVMEVILQDPSRLEKMGKKARERIEAFYSLEISLERWEAFFRELLQRKTGKGKVHHPDPPLPMPALDFFNAREGKERPSPWQRFKDKVRIRSRLKEIFNT